MATPSFTETYFLCIIFHATVRQRSNTKYVAWILKIICKKDYDVITYKALLYTLFKIYGTHVCLQKTSGVLVSFTRRE